MKISQIIEQLKSIKDDHGDLEVICGEHEVVFHHGVQEGSPATLTLIINERNNPEAVLVSDGVPS